MLRYYILIPKILVDRRENIDVEERWGNGGQRQMVWVIKVAQMQM